MSDSDANLEGDTRQCSFENPYFDEVAGGVTVGANRASWNQEAVDLLERRLGLVDEYAFAIPNEAAVATIAEHAPILEVGAGDGYWARCVRDYLDDTEQYVATEPKPRAKHVWDIPIIKQDAVDAIEEFGDGRTLFICWPPYDDPMASDALDVYQGDTVIYIGEGRGGCTATDGFHKQLHNWWRLEETVAIPTYLGLHDRLEVWHRAE